MVPYVNGAVPKIIFKVTPENADFAKEKEEKLVELFFLLLSWTTGIGVMF